MVAQWPEASLRQTAGVANQTARPILCTLGGAVLWNPMGNPPYLVCFQISSLRLCLRGRVSSQTRCTMGQEAAFPAGKTWSAAHHLLGDA